MQRPAVLAVLLELVPAVQVPVRRPVVGTAVRVLALVLAMVVQAPVWAALPQGLLDRAEAGRVARRVLVRTVRAPVPEPAVPAWVAAAALQALALVAQRLAAMRERATPPVREAALEAQVPGQAAQRPRVRRAAAQSVRAIVAAPEQPVAEETVVVAVRRAA